MHADLTDTTTASESLEPTLPATPIVLDREPPRAATVELWSGRRYHIETRDDGMDHVVVTTRAGTIALSLLVTDDGPVLTFACADVTCPPCAVANETVTLPVYRPTLPAAPDDPGCPSLPLEQFVALSAELAAFPERAAVTMPRYGVCSHAEYRRLERAWFARLADDPALERRWRSLYDACATWLATIGR